MGWEDTDGDGHKELNGDVGPLAAGVAAGLGVKAGVEAAVAGGLAASVVGAPAAPFVAVVAGVDAAGAAGAAGLAYFADRYGWKYKIEPGQVIEVAGEAIESAKDKAGDAVDWAKEKAGAFKDRLNPFDGDGPPFLGGPLIGPSNSLNKVGGQALRMRRLEEAFARLQSLL